MLLILLLLFRMLLAAALKEEDATKEHFGDQADQEDLEPFGPNSDDLDSDFDEYLEEELWIASQDIRS